MTRGGGPAYVIESVCVCARTHGWEWEGVGVWVLVCVCRQSTDMRELFARCVFKRFTSLLRIQQL